MIIFRDRSAFKIRKNRTNGGIGMAGRKSNLDKELVINLYKNGLTYRAIAEKVQSNEDAVRMLIKRNASAELSKKKEARQVRKQATSLNNDYIHEHSNVLNVEAYREIWEERRNGIDTNESIGTYAFIQWNRQSYLTDKDGNLVFDENRGGITKDVPKKYQPII